MKRQSEKELSSELPSLTEGVVNKSEWALKRQEILDIYRREVYGGVTDFPWELTSQEISCKTILGGTAQMRQIRVTLNHKEKESAFTILLFTPLNGPSPLFLGLNFKGNHTVFPDLDIDIPRQNGTENQQCSPVHCGSAASRWPVARILERGYALATIYCGEIDPDFHDGFNNGVHGLSEREPGQWGTISAWAWGLSRAMDVLTERKEIDSDRVAVIGHSRLGKTALWAGAQDERFCLAISNDSGCGGASLFRHREGEAIEDIIKNFPHWFTEPFNKYSNKPDELPLDQHALLSLMAPRKVYVASAQEDSWADPRGEYLGLYHAGPVWELAGKEGLSSLDSPELNRAVFTDSMGYHMREGVHDITLWDWERFMDFWDY
jgi:hypothetical protein